jgi:large subunit ribosomal protein L15
VINVSRLGELKAGGTVSLDSLEQAGLVTSPRYPLKVLGNGELKVKLTVQAAAFTASARAKIEAAGGTCEIID